jgi:hypothetical protein
MNPFIQGFKDCAHQAAEICGFTITRLTREFGLQDFLENCLREEDDASTIAVKALVYFCDDPNPHAPVFKFAVLTVGIFLNHFHAGGKKQVPQQALRDLVTQRYSSALAHGGASV